MYDHPVCLPAEKDKTCKCEEHGTQTIASNMASKKVQVNLADQRQQPAFGDVKYASEQEYFFFLKIETRSFVAHKKPRLASQET